MSPKLDKLDVLDVLSSLCDKSLANADIGRYRFLETVRQYAQELVSDPAEDAELRSRHLDYYVSFAELAETKLRGAEQKEWLDQLNSEDENMRSALAWSLEGKEYAKGLRLANALWIYWSIKGHYDDGIHWYEEALQLDPSQYGPADLGNGFTRFGNLLKYRGDDSAALQHYEKALVIRRGLDDKLGIASVLHNLGGIQYRVGEFALAREFVEESLAIRILVGDEAGLVDSNYSLGEIWNADENQDLAYGFLTDALALATKLGDKRSVARILNCIGNVIADMGFLAEASPYYEQALEDFRELGDRQSTAVSLCNLGLVEARQGHADAALAFYLEGGPLTRELKNKRDIAFVLEGLALVAVHKGDLVGACRIWGAAEALRDDIGSPMSPVDRRHFDGEVSSVRATLGDDSLFEQAWAGGRRITMDEALDFALHL